MNWLDYHGPGVSPRNRRAFLSVFEAIGWTPMIRLGPVTRSVRTPVYAKAEFLNPAGSITDRTGLAIIEAAERNGGLRRGGTIVQATGGSACLGLAFAAALRGYGCVFVLPDDVREEEIRLLHLVGAETVTTPAALPHGHPEHFLHVAQRFAAETAGAVLANPFSASVEPETHYRTTGPEIWEQSSGRVTHLVGSADTAGALGGAGRFLKERNAAIRVVVAGLDRPAASPASTGEPGTAETYSNDLLGGEQPSASARSEVLDEFMAIAKNEAARMARRLAREEGLLVGPSSGLSAQLALQLASEANDPQALVVCVLPDSGMRRLPYCLAAEQLPEHNLRRSGAQATRAPAESGGTVERPGDARALG